MNNLIHCRKLVKWREYTVNVIDPGGKIWSSKRWLSENVMLDLN